MNSPRKHEMNKLQTIDRQREAIQLKLDERLPRQHSQLAALVSFTKWRLTALHRQRSSAYTQELVDATTKKLRMEVGAFEYAAKEQSELLTRALFQLDDILSHGDVAIKDARKALVLTIQQLLERADTMNAKAASLKKFTERTIERLPTPAVAEATTDEPMEDISDAANVDEQASTAATPMEQDDEWEHVHAGDLRPLFTSDDEDDKTQDQEALTESETMGDTVMVQPEEPENNDETLEDEPAEEDEQDDEPEEENEQADEPEEEDADVEDEDVQPNATEQDKTESRGDEIDSLPVWRPYYQIQKRADGVYLIANLHGVDPQNVQVEAVPRHGVLRISGAKFPTRKDILLSRLSGTPTFGRFEIVERFPPHMLNLENASQQVSYDGTLQVRLPFYVVQRPRVLRRVSPFQPGLVVW